MDEISIKNFFNELKPERAVFVLSVDKEGRPSGMIAGWVMKCSSQPPLFAAALSKRGYTHKLIQQSREFVVAVPDKTLEEELNFFGSTHGNEVDKFKQTGLETVPAKHIKTTLIKKAAFNIECRLYSETEAGDHIIFIGEILAAYKNRGRKVLMNMGKKDGKRIYQDFDII